jgi:hypothetical protein
MDTSMSPEQDTRIDDAIDEVARQLTAGSPGRHFRARVLARIDEPGRTRSGWRTAWMWSRAVVAAMILVAVIRGEWQAHRVIAPTQARQAAVAASPLRSVPVTTQGDAHASSHAIHETAPVAPQTALAVPQTTRAARRAPSRTAPVIDEWPEESPIAALAPDRIDVPRMRIVALAPAESIQLSEMSILPIDVAPLDRDGHPQD